MDISFTGYKNVGGYTTAGRIVNGCKTTSHKLIVQLNNFETKDLDEFSSVFKKYPDKVKNNFLVVDVVKSENMKTKDKSKLYYINKQRLFVNDDNLGIFSKISKLVTRINEDGSEFKIANDYKKGEDFKILASGEKPVSAGALDIVSDAFHDRNNTKETALNIYKSINSTMRHYFGVPKY